MENAVFLGKTKQFRGKKLRLFVFLLGAGYTQKGSEIEFSSIAEEILFFFILRGFALNAWFTICCLNELKARLKVIP